MFQLFDRTRRGMSILLFFLLGPGLTATVAVAVVRRHLPSATEQQAEQLSCWLESPVRIRRSVPIRPRQMVYHELKIGHRSKNPYLYCPKIHINWHSQRHASPLPKSTSGKDVSAKRIAMPSGYLTVHIPEIAIDPNRASLIPVFFDRLLSANIPSEIPVLLTVDQLRLVTTDKKNATDHLRYTQDGNGKEPRKQTGDNVSPLQYRLTELQAIFIRKASRTTIKLTFHLPDVATEEPVVFRVVREQGKEAIETAFIFSTSDATLPCSLAALFCNAFAPFEGGRFRGQLIARLQEDPLGDQSPRWSVQLENFDFHQLDFQKLSSACTSYPLKGKVARFGVQSAVLQEGRLKRATGWIEANDGTLPATLLKRFVTSLALTTQPADILPSTELPIPFDQMIVYFHFDENGGRFWSSHPSGLLLKTGNEFGLYQTNTRIAIPYSTLLQILAPPEAPSIPLTAHSERWLRHLPVEKTLTSENATEESILRPGLTDSNRDTNSLIDTLSQDDRFLTRAFSGTREEETASAASDERINWPRFQQPIRQAGFQYSSPARSRLSPTSPLRSVETIDTADYAVPRPSPRDVRSPVQRPLHHRSPASAPPPP